MMVKPVVVVKLRFVVPSPCCFFSAGENHTLIGIGGLHFGPDIILAVGRTGIAPSFLEPWMINRTMVNYEIYDHANAPFLGRPRKRDKIAQGSQLGIYIVVIGDVVSVIAVWRWVKRLEPNAIDIQAGDIV